jgi:hypothetical protein
MNIREGIRMKGKTQRELEYALQKKELVESEIQNYVDLLIKSIGNEEIYLKRNNNFDKVYKMHGFDKSTNDKILELLGIHYNVVFTYDYSKPHFIYAENSLITSNQLTSISANKGNMMQLTVKKFDSNSMKIEDVGNSHKWNNDSESKNGLAKWLNEHSTLKSRPQHKRYALKGPVGVNEKYVHSFNTDSLGVFMSTGNNCSKNVSETMILSSRYSTTNCIYIHPNNFSKLNVSFSAKKLISGSWLNNNDEYRVPSDEIQITDKYKQFNNDCFVYSLFSLQSSMRDVPNFDDTAFNIHNHFFYMSNEEMKDLADKHNFTKMYQDADEFHEDRYMYNKLQKLKLSKDAKDILKSLRELTKKSMKYRELAHQDDDKYHLHAWDAGWYQIRMGILKKYMKDDLKKFMVKFKQFENRLRPMVYEFGFLPYENKINESI